MPSEFSHFEAGPWPRGMTNVFRDTELPNDALLDAMNLDVRRDGSVNTRLQWERVLTANAHSFFRHDSRVFAVIDSELCELDESGATPIMADVGRIHWSVLNDKPVFATDEAVYEVSDQVTMVSGVDRDFLDLDDDLIPLPGGHWLEYWNGRLVVARGTTLLFSEPLRYGAHNPMTGYINLASRIEWVVALEDGLYVGLHDQVMFLQGRTPEQLQATRVAGRSSPGMGISISGEYLSPELAANPRVAVFFTPSGFTLGLPGGQVTYPQKSTLRNLPLFRGKIVENGGRLYAVRGL